MTREIGPAQSANDDDTLPGQPMEEFLHKEKVAAAQRKRDAAKEEFDIAEAELAEIRSDVNAVKQDDDSL